MESFLNEVFSFPMIIFTLPLIFLLMYWALALFGLLDIELLDLNASDNEGDVTGGGNWLSFLGLEGVPLAASMLFLDFYAWLFTFAGKKIITHLFDGSLTGAAMGSIVALVALIVAIPLTVLSIKPLKRMFKMQLGPNKSELTGKVCVLTTTKVTKDFGQAELEDGSMILNIRADEPNNLKKGTRLVLLGYDEQTDRYDVISEDKFLNKIEGEFECL
ncbi:hypothetical protein [Pseudoalteromonas sp. GB56]